MKRTEEIFNKSDFTEMRMGDFVCYIHYKTQIAGVWLKSSEEAFTTLITEDAMSSQCVMEALEAAYANEKLVRIDIDAKARSVVATYEESE